MRDFQFRLLNRLSVVVSTLVACSAIAVTAQGWSASGTVKNASGVGLAGVSVTVKDSASIQKVTTDGNGNFTIGRTAGILDSRRSLDVSAMVVGTNLVLQGPKDGPVELSMVDASGRSLWTASVVVNQGGAQVALPSGLSRTAVFLRIRHADGVQFQAIQVGSSDIRLSAPMAARSMATFPTLVFNSTGYEEATYPMTATSQTGIAVTMKDNTTCAFPTTFKWKDNGAAIATPANGWTSIKDFTGVTYNGKRYIYMTMYQGGYGGAMMAPFTNWSEAATAKQTKLNKGTVAPELMYFTPKNQWILSYQWCGSEGKFCYATSTDPTNATSWGTTKSLLREDVATPQGAAYGPIDQVPICDATTCYLFYAGDNGHIYRASMPIGNFPGEFKGSVSILSDTKNNLFEAVEVYTIKGQKKYLMIVEAMGSARFFRAYTATSLGGAWEILPGTSTEASPFAGRRNITNPPSWTNDVSHGDLVRTHDETRTIDPCNLQLLYQGYAASFSGAYDLKPYRLGLLTYTK